MIKNLFFTLFLLLIAENLSHAKVYKKIEVNGNKRISYSNIISIINFDKNKNYEVSDINEFQKKLFKTNFFKNIKIKTLDNKIVIKLEENPVVKFFYIRGIVKKSREELVYDRISLDQNKIFTESILKNDIDKILSIYRDAGYFHVKVTPQATLLSDNTMNVVIDIERNNKSKIKKINFIGSKFYSSSNLENTISSTTHGWWKFLSGSTTLNMNRVEYDISLLKNFYLDRGFYDVQISSNDIKFDNSKNAIITYSINSGERYTFDSFSLNDDEKNLKEEQIAQIKNIIKEKLNGIYSKKNIIKVRRLIYEYLNSNKIEFVKFNIIEEKQNNKKISFNFNFVKTDRKFVNLINISGNTLTEGEVIRRNLSFAEGDTYVDYKKENSLRSLNNTKIFGKVNIDEKQVTSELIDINIDVEEKPTGSVSAGVGIGTNDTSIGGTLNEDNLFGKGIAANLDLNIGTQKVSGAANFNIPDFNNTGNTLGFGAYIVETDYDNAGYESTVVGSVGSLKYNLYEDTFFKFGASIDIDDISADTKASSNIKSRDGEYMTYKGFYSLTHDTRNRVIKTTDGHVVGFGQNLSVPPSDITYLDNSVFGSYFHSFSKDYIFNIRGKATSINSLNNKDIKMSDRKFLSNKNLRGFENFGTGPKDGSIFVGGNYSAYTSISSSFPNPLPDQWNANTNIFFDMGNIWGVDYNSSLDNNEIRSSTGISLEWISPIGPLTFTYAEPVSKAPTDIEENFTFQLGSTF